MSIIQQLVKKGLLDQEKANALIFEAKKTGKREEEILIEKKVISEEVLFQLKSEILKVPLKEISTEDVLPEVLDLIPEESARYYQMVPLVKKGNILEVGLLYPEDLKTQEALRFLARQENFEYKPFLILPSTFRNLLKKYTTLKGEVKKALEELKAELPPETPKKRARVSAPEIERLVEEAPISKVVGVVLRHAVEGRASDIHIEPTKDKVRIRFRVDGVLYSSLFLPLKIHPAIIARIKILSNLKIDETRIPQDGRFSAPFAEKEIDFRVSTFPTAMGEKVALRILDPTMGQQSFEELGIVGRNLKVLRKAVEKPFGMVLATGPTGSGKTTTLYAILNLLNKEGVNILTIEDPIEYYIDGINQSEVRPEIGYNFARALRHMVRQDPDIIMVGEIRDPETASLATHAALTGHILLSTLHTNNAIGAIPRMIDLGIKPFLIPPTLNAVISQRLVRRLCPDCKKRERPSPEIEELILKELESIPLKAKEDLKIPDIPYIWRAGGCQKCNLKGMIGRIGIFEILIMTDSLAEIIRREPSEKAIAEEAKRQGMITMRQDGILKVLEGLTSIEEVLRVTTEE